MSKYFNASERYCRESDYVSMLTDDSENACLCDLDLVHDLSITFARWSSPLIATMSAFGMVEKLIRTYPDTSPFQLATPIFNLIPEPDVCQKDDTEDVKKAALAIAQAHDGHNVFSTMLGSSPLPLLDQRWMVAEFPFTAYSRPPPLQQVLLPSSVEFAEALSADTHAISIVAYAAEWDCPRMLKVVCCAHAVVP